ncbi:hypothetical protein V2E39_21375 [Chryseobacterium arthrosphaerae]|uniref:DUF4595 domain-containing protein n=1 Tax=Chryseobacterium arthrosphaerae TaxID=651561 RepID=A0ABU7R586_9FLAO|nr:hypothetical protein [Chryseobacterium arthrosphaerae]
MKKLFYIVFALSLFSCSTDNDATENSQADLEPDKGYIFEMDLRSVMPSPEKYYRFSYESGRLKSMLGRSYHHSSIGSVFHPDVLTLFTYSNNKVQIDYLGPEGSEVYRTAYYLMENNRPVKEEIYDNYTKYPSYLVTSKTYTYENNKIKIYQKRGGVEYYTTYFFDSQQNLTKSEILQKAGGIDEKVTTTTYSDFDNAKNPFKKLYLINDDFYEKGLSTNNFRTKETVSQYLPTPTNGNTNYPPGYAKDQWSYNYDSNGQILLYYPLKKL